MPVWVSIQLNTVPPPMTRMMQYIALAYCWNSCSFVLRRLARPVGDASSLSIPAIAGSISSSCGCICSCVSFARIIRSANGPPSMEPAISPKVAAAMPMVSAPSSPIALRTPAKPPAVPCPPVMEILPAAIPISGSTPITRVMPIGIRFCMEMITTNSPNMITSSLPP